jgi:hypothetical protein
MLDDTKFTKKLLDSIFLIAKLASLGMLGLSLIISKESSLIFSIIALNSSFSAAGRASSKAFVVAFKTAFSLG